MSWTSTTGTKHIWSGTSVSAPFVSATVALMLSEDNTLTPNQVYNILKITTDKIGQYSYDNNGWNRYLGYGRIDAANAVNVATGAPAKPRNVNVEPSQNNHPYLTWDANTEPDLSNYKVYKYVNYETGWQYLAQTVNNYYEDVTEDYCTSYPLKCINQENIYYRVTAVDNDSKESVPSDSVLAPIQGNPPSKIGADSKKQIKPVSYSLGQNYPNPFNPTTRIDYSIKQAGFVTLKIYDMLGKEVAVLVNGNKPAGYYTVEFNGSNLPSGVYIYRLTAGKFSSSKKLMLMK